MTTVQAIDPIQLIDRLLNEGEDIYDLAVSIGLAGEETMTAERWIQGDLVLRVQRKYGDNIIVKFATALNVNTSTLKQRRTMSNYYTKDTRVSFPNIGYSHYREAMKLDDINKSLWALEKASIKDWPVWKFSLLLNRLLGKKTTAASITGHITGYDGRNVLIEIDLPLNSFRYEAGQEVTLKIKP